MDGLRGNAILSCPSPQSSWSILETPQKTFFNTLGDEGKREKATGVYSSFIIKGIRVTA